MSERRMFSTKKRKLLEHRVTGVTCGVKFCRGCKGLDVPSSPEDKVFYCCFFCKILKYKSIGGAVRCKECLKAEQTHIDRER